MSEKYKSDILKIAEKIHEGYLKMREHRDNKSYTSIFPAGIFYDVLRDKIFVSPINMPFIPHTINIGALTAKEVADIDPKHISNQCFIGLENTITKIHKILEVFAEALRRGEYYDKFLDVLNAIIKEHAMSIAHAEQEISAQNE
ncbi:MAG: hypothetical protein PHX51_08495 [Clostridia bacterium]|nr:hypothetical protein [Clostridia bacterium]